MPSSGIVVSLTGCPAAYAGPMQQWLRIRRYELVRGTGPLAIHDIATTGVPSAGHPALAEATSTDWRASMVLGREVAGSLVPTGWPGWCELVPATRTV